MNILHITFNMAIGGTEQVIRQIVRGTREQVNHHILCIDGEIGDWGQALRETGIAVSAFSRSGGLDIRLLKYIRSYIRRERIDIIHGHQYTPYIYAIFPALFSRTKVVFTEHGRFYPDSYKWKRRLVNPVLAMFTDRVIAISHATAHALAQYEWIPLKKIEVIYNGTDIEPCNNSEVSRLRASLDLENAIVFGTVARLDPIKNQPLLIQAFAKLCLRLSAARLVIVGDGPERQKLENLVSKLGITDRVLFTGFITNPAPYFSLIDVFILSSFSEGTSVTLLESMAAGRVAIVSNVGGNPEIVEDGVSGLVFDSEDLEGLTQCMIEVKGHETRDRLGKAAKNRYLEKFTTSRMNSAYMSIYSALVD